MSILSTSNLPRRLGALLLIALVAGCASSRGINPRASLTTSASLGATGTVTYPATDWWTAYGDATLNELIATALAGNPTIRIAQARLDRAQANAEVAGAASLPQLSASADSSRQKLSQNYIYPPPLGGSTQSLNTATLNAGWEIDLFGRHRAALDAAIGSSKAAQADREAARVLLAARVASSYFALAQKLEQRAVAVTTLADREALQKLVAQRVNAGLDTNVELRQAEGTVPQVRQEIALLDEQIAINRHALAALLGAGPQAADGIAPTLAARTTPTLPTTLPADLLGRRADIAAARWRVEAAIRDIDAAKAEFYPNLNLTAFIGFQSLGLAKWLLAGSQMAGIGPAVHLPIFDGGRLKGNLRAKNADFDAAVEDYNAKLIDALRDVADQLASTGYIDTQAREQQAALAAAEGAYDLAQQRYRAGLSTYLTVLTAQLAVEQQRRGTIDLKARRYALDIELARALGGGFRDDAASALQQAAAAH
jgi:NodT family efflux transporter outer membrane factor (OMF) lipoprotein